MLLVYKHGLFREATLSKLQMLESRQVANWRDFFLVYEGI